MGRRSTRKNKTIYQQYREDAHLTREKASELMDISSSKLEKFEFEKQIPLPYDILQMADCYKRPDLCNYYCSQQCEIGCYCVPELKLTNLSDIIIKTIANLTQIEPLIKRFLEIGEDGKITDNEIKDFAKISQTLDNLSLAVATLNLWLKNESLKSEFNLQLFTTEKEKLKSN